MGLQRGQPSRAFSMTAHGGAGPGCAADVGAQGKLGGRASQHLRWCLDGFSLCSKLLTRLSLSGLPNTWPPPSSAALETQAQTPSDIIFPFHLLVLCTLSFHTSLAVIYHLLLLQSFQQQAMRSSLNSFTVS